MAAAGTAGQHRARCPSLGGGRASGRCVSCDWRCVPHPTAGPPSDAGPPPTRPGRSTGAGARPQRDRRGAGTGRRAERCDAAAFPLHRSGVQYLGLHAAAAADWAASPPPPNKRKTCWIGAGDRGQGPPVRHSLRPPFPGDWAAVPAAMNMRMMGDSTYQFLSQQLPGMWEIGGKPVITDAASHSGGVLFLPSGAMVRWRYFRALDCSDGIFPWLRPDVCNPTGKVPFPWPKTHRGGNATSPCNGVFGLDHTDVEAGGRGYNAVFLTVGWWTVIYTHPSEWPRDCRDHHAARRRNASIFWVQPLATNQTHAPRLGDVQPDAWRILWNDRIAALDAVVWGEVKGLVDDVVPIAEMAL
eukprot:gene36501-62273_t